MYESDLTRLTSTIPLNSNPLKSLQLNLQVVYSASTFEVVVRYIDSAGYPTGAVKPVAVNIASAAAPININFFITLLFC